MLAFLSMLFVAEPTPFVSLGGHYLECPHDPEGMECGCSSCVRLVARCKRCESMLLREIAREQRRAARRARKKAR